MSAQEVLAGPAEAKNLAGTVGAMSFVTAPFSARRCVAYRASLAWWRRFFLKGRRFEQSGIPFYLRIAPNAANPTGQILVDSRGARLLVESQRFRLAYNDDRLLAFNRRMGLRPARGPASMLEGAIVIGDRVEVCGWEYWVANPAGVAWGYRQAPRLPFLQASSIRLLGRAHGAIPMVQY